MCPNYSWGALGRTYPLVSICFYANSYGWTKRRSGWGGRRRYHRLYKTRSHASDLSFQH